MFSKKDSAKSQENAAAKNNLKKARERLAEYKCDKADAEYDRRNEAVIKAEKALPWHKR